MPKADGSSKRARTDEQKQARMEAILLAADTLLDAHAYRDITMTMIADGLGFSRANLVHYVATKEEIFLRLYVRDIEALAADVAAVSYTHLDVYKRQESPRTMRGIGMRAVSVSMRKDRRFAYPASPARCPIISICTEHGQCKAS